MSAAGNAVESTVDPAALTYDAQGLLPVVVQEVGSGAVLMLAFADREAVEKTLATGFVHFWSRSRQALWKKGETSGNTLEAVSVTADCDGDALLVRARANGPTCHRGTRSCFEPNPSRLELGWLMEVLEARRAAGDIGSGASYTARLLAAGLPRIAQKVGEEAVETVVAALTGAGNRDELVLESSDLLYHLLVLLLASGVGPEEVAAELLRRAGKPGQPKQEEGETHGR
jgi:phosphoribosyl-ATP pyrophosphohydrolase/phosphoribosyl-AMP cyclohydrolase